MIAGLPDAALAACALVILAASVGSLTPFVPLEPLLLTLGALAPASVVVPTVVIATIAHVAVKTIVCYAGRRAGSLVGGRHRALVERASAGMKRGRAPRIGTLFLSGITGLPPFYLCTLLWGALRLPLAQFVAIGVLARGIRFGALAFAPSLFR